MMFYFFYFSLFCDDSFAYFSRSRSLSLSQYAYYSNIVFFLYFIVAAVVVISLFFQKLFNLYDSKCKTNNTNNSSNNGLTLKAETLYELIVIMSKLKQILFDDLMCEIAMSNVDLLP